MSKHYSGVTERARRSSSQEAIRLRVHEQLLLKTGLFLQQTFSDLLLWPASVTDAGDMESNQRSPSWFMEEDRMPNKQSEQHDKYRVKGLRNHTEGHPVFDGQGRLLGGSGI